MGAVTVAMVAATAATKAVTSVYLAADLGTRTGHTAAVSTLMHVRARAWVQASRAHLSPFARRGW